jgi:phage virion morphogenesis protein
MELIYNDAEVIAGLQRLLDKTGNIRPAQSEIGELVADSTKRRFGTTTSPEGISWAANSDITIERKGHARPLTGTSGVLMDSIHSVLDGDFAVEIGSGQDQAAMMQFGGTKEEFPHLWGDIPARPYLGISEEDKAAILAVIGRHLSL